MTPDELAKLHELAFTTGRPWSAAEFADLCAPSHTHLSTHEHGFALWRGIATEAELLTVAVSPLHQGRGIGRSLMQDWMSAAAAFTETAFLEVAGDNTPARRLYETCGFQIVATRPAYYDRPQGKVDALVMQAALSRPEPSDTH